MCFIKVKEIQDQASIYSELGSGRTFEEMHYVGTQLSKSFRNFITYSLILSISTVTLTDIKFKMLQSRNIQKQIQLSNRKDALVPLPTNSCLLEGNS